MFKNKSRREMAAEYGVSARTFSRMLEKSNIILPPGFITPKFQKKIYEQFGDPASVMRHSDSLHSK